MPNRLSRRQHTIAKPVRVAGRGYWGGRSVTVEFRPAAAGEGVHFVRRDLPGLPRVAAQVHHRQEVPRRTVLVEGTARVAMVEHVLAALAGLQIDNCEVWVNAEEMPACDGSSAAFVAALLGTGLVKQTRIVSTLVVQESIRVGDEQAWVEARPARNNAFEISYELDYGPGNPIGRQALSLKVTPSAFQAALAPARTFLLEAEAAQLRAQNLGTHIGYQDLLVFGSQGPLDNRLRFDDECVRHKMLDMVGDLALAGHDLVGSFRAYRSGHRLNAELVRRLLTAPSAQRAA
jgi:UDP-3-O-[3-hydroxymyristoyl] N-acetylglucosamine deacetylase